jgi:hypothetical protein
MKSLAGNKLSVPAVSLVLAAAATVAAAPARADDVVRWRAVIGLVQPENTVGSGTGQAFGGVQPWSTLGGRAKLDLQSGRLEFEVRGLVRAGGNGIGIPEIVTPTGAAPLTQVIGTLVCDTDGSAGGGNSVLVDTDPVPLSAAGDARFSGVVQLQAACLVEPDIAFLIRIPTPVGNWIANGSVRIRNAGDQDAD